MMNDARSLTSNVSLLHNCNPKNKDTDAYDLVSTITANRPLQDAAEARIASYHLNNILSFVEYACGPDKYSVPSDGATERIFGGLSEIMNACRLVSLRVEQYLDIQEEERR